MKERFAFAWRFVLLSGALVFTATAQSIYTPYAFTNFAGAPGGPGVADGAGRAARFSGPSATATDAAGNVYVAEQLNFAIRKITPAGVVSTIAGNPRVPGTNDGIGTSARFGSAFGGPLGITVDGAGNVYVSDSYNYTIRKLTPAGGNWTVSTLAGRPLFSGTNDGVGGVARLASPAGMATDTAGNIYLADKFAIRRITPAGEVTTLAGSISTAGAVDGTNSAARFGSAFFGGPKGLVVDESLNIYVADTHNYFIRKITPVGPDWVVTTFAGAAGSYGWADGVNSTAQFENPHGITRDGAGNFYVTDAAASIVRKIALDGTDRVVTTFGGTVPFVGSQDGTSGAARFWVPQGISTDADGNLYVADFGNNTIRKITPAAEVTTFAGQSGGPGLGDGVGSAARFDVPHSAAVDGAGNVYIGDTFNHTIRKITPAGEVSTVAGSPKNKGYVDGVGLAEAPRFASPIGVAADTAGNLYVSDNSNQTIRKVTSDGTVTTFAGKVGVKGNVNGNGTNATFNSPNGVAVDSVGNVFVADLVNRTIRKITPGGEVTLFTGRTSSQGTNDGAPGVARFTAPMGLAIDSANNLYVADQGADTIRKVTPDGVVSTLAGLGKVNGTNDGVGNAARFNAPEGVAVDLAGNVYVSDTSNQTIRKITPGGTVTTLAGTPRQRGSANGTNNVAQFDTPRGIAVDGATNVFVSDSGNSTIRKLVVTGADCVVTTLAGNVEENGSLDDTGTAARFHFPHGLAVDAAGNLYSADRSNHDIRKITPAGVVKTFVGVPGLEGSQDGKGAAGQFYGPEELAVDDVGNIFVVEHFSNTVRQIAPNGTNWIVTTLAGCASCPEGTNDGPGVLARFKGPFGLTRDPAGNLYVADTGARTIRKLTRSGQDWTVTTFAGWPDFGASVDGVGSSARFAAPLGLAADADGIYVGDASTIRKITYDAVVTTLAGCNSCAPNFTDGIGTNAVFWGARGVAVDGEGNIFVADQSNQLVRKLTPSGGAWAVTTVGGSPGQASSIDGVGSDARFSQPTGVAVDSQGNLYVVNAGENNVVKGTLPGAPVVVRFDTSGDNLIVANGALQMRFTGASGGSLLLEMSTDLLHWTPILTNPIVPGGFNVSVPLDNLPWQFIRGTVLP